MGRIMDRVSFRRRGRCNVCCMVKKLPQAEVQLAALPIALLVSFALLLAVYAVNRRLAVVQP